MQDRELGAALGKKVFGSKKNEVLETKYFDDVDSATNYAKEKKRGGFRADVTEMKDGTFRVRVEKNNKKNAVEISVPNSILTTSKEQRLRSAGFINVGVGGGTSEWEAKSEDRYAVIQQEVNKIFGADGNKVDIYET